MFVQVVSPTSHEEYLRSGSATLLTLRNELFRAGELVMLSRGESEGVSWLMPSVGGCRICPLEQSVAHGNWQVPRPARGPTLRPLQAAGNAGRHPAAFTEAPVAVPCSIP